MNRDSIKCPYCAGEVYTNTKDGAVTCVNCAAILSYTDEGNIQDIEVKGSNHEEVERVALSLSRPSSNGEDMSAKSDKSIKEKFENHPLVFGGSLLIAGLLAGIGMMKFLFPLLQAKEVTTLLQSETKIECNLVGLSELNASHNQRVAIMQERLLDFESKASDQSLISSYQSKYLESANRIREDIEGENEVLKASVGELKLKCENVHNN